MKKALSFLAAFVLLVAFAPNASAYDGSVTLESGQTIYYNYLSSNNQTIQVTYPGTSTSNPWSGYTKPTGALVIPDSITHNGVKRRVAWIDNYAFYNCTDLTSVTIPNSVIVIGQSAFFNVRHIEYYGNATGSPWGAISKNGVTEGNFVYSDSTKHYLTAYIGAGGVVTIPSTVDTIGNQAFYHCTGLTSVTIPNTVTSINYFTFAGCSGLTSITIPNSVTSIGQSAFAGCSGLTSITIPDSVTSIGQSAFSGCSGLTSVTIPDAVTTIGTYAFANCELDSLTIGRGLTTIGDNAFNNDTISYLNYNCPANVPSAINKSRLATVIIGDSVTSISNYAFQYCDSLTSVTIGNSVTSIDNCSFYQCSGLTAIAIPNNVTLIGQSAFSRCSSMTSVTIGNGVTSIDYAAFSYCTGLTSITIPDGVSSIGGYAFGECQNLDTVYMRPTTPPTLGSSDAFYNNASGRVFILNGCSFDNYYTDYSGDRWSYYRYDLRDPIIDINVTLTNASIIQLRDRDVRCDSTVVVKASANNGYHEGSWWDPESYWSNTGSYFDHWSNGSTVNPDTLQLTGDTSLTAYLITFTVASDNTTMGSVEREEGNYARQQVIYAVANEGYHFTHWSNGSTANPEYITIVSDSMVTAFFERNTYHLSANVNDATLGTVVFPLNDSALYQDTLTVVATPIAHHHVASWQGQDIVATSANKDTVWVRMNDNCIVTCNFAIDTHTVAVAANDIARGSVSGGGEFAYGTPCTLTATAYSGYTFLSWSNGMTDNPYTFAVMEDVELTAVFLAPGEETYTVTVSVNDPTMGTATVNSNATATVMSGTEVTLTATPNSGYRFVKWSDDNTEPTRTVTVTEDLSFTATFESDGTQGIEGVVTLNLNVYVENGSIRVTLAGQAVDGFAVYDIMGRTVVNVKDAGKTPILPSGIYLVKVGALPTKKVVVIR